MILKFFNVTTGTFILIFSLDKNSFVKWRVINYETSDHCLPQTSIKID